MAAPQDLQFVRKQRSHCFARESLDDDGNITMWALGGFVPDDPEEAVAFLRTSTPYLQQHNANGAKLNVERIIAAENEYRLGLVDKINRFIRVLDQTNCSVRRACKMSGLYRMQADMLRSRIPEFAKRWQEVYEDTTDKLEEAGIHRAVYGTKDPIFQQGVQVGYKRSYSDSLLAMMLQGRRSGTYRSKSSTELTGKDGGPIPVASTTITMTPEEFKAIAKQVADDV